jgi:hypothetical protein
MSIITASRRESLTMCVIFLHPVKDKCGMALRPSHSATRPVGPGSTIQTSLTYVGSLVGNPVVGGGLGNGVVGDGVVGDTVSGDGCSEVGGRVGCDEVGAAEMIGGVGAEVGVQVLS